MRSRCGRSRPRATARLGPTFGELDFGLHRLTLARHPTRPRPVGRRRGPDGGVALEAEEKPDEHDRHGIRREDGDVVRQHAVQQPKRHARREDQEVGPGQVIGRPAAPRASDLGEPRRSGEHASDEAEVLHAHVVLPRTMSEVGWGRVGPCIRPAARKAHSRPKAKRSWCTVVSPGVLIADSSMSSKPTTATSFGTSTSAERNACIAPRARTSVAARIPHRTPGSQTSRNDSAAALPAVRLLPACSSWRTVDQSMPAARSAAAPAGDSVSELLADERTADDGEATKPEIHEVLRGETTAAEVVGRDVRDRRHAARGPDGDDREAPFDRGEERRIVGRERPSDEGIDCGVAHAAPRAWSRRVDDLQREVRLVGTLRDAAHEQGGTGIGERVRDADVDEDAEHLGRATSQRSTDRTRAAVVELGGCGEDTLPGRRRHDVGPAVHVGHRHPRHAGSRRDVIESGAGSSHPWRLYGYKAGWCKRDRGFSGSAGRTGQNPGHVLDQLGATVERSTVDHVECDIGVAVVDPLAARCFP